MLSSRLGILVSALLLGGPAYAACVTPAPVSSENIARFQESPASLLTANPTGGPAMIAQVRDLASSDVGTIRALTALAASANPSQASAIGTGLAQAAGFCVRSDAEAARAIQVAVIQSPDSRIASAFRAVAGDLQTFAVGGGGGAGGGGGSGGAGVGSSPTTTATGFAAGGNSSQLTPNSGLSITTAGSAVTLGNTQRISNQSSPF
jgi:hypothetical protein